MGVCMKNKNIPILNHVFVILLATTFLGYCGKSWGSEVSATQKQIDTYWNEKIVIPYKNFTTDFKEQYPIIALYEKSNLERIDEILSKKPNLSWGLRTYNPYSFLKYTFASPEETEKQMKELIDKEKEKIEAYKVELQEKFDYLLNLWQKSQAKSTLRVDFIKGNASLNKTISQFEKRIETLDLALEGIIFLNDISATNLNAIDREFRFLLNFINRFNLQTKFEAFLYKQQNKTLDPYTLINSYVLDRLSKIKSAKLPEAQNIAFELNDIKNNILDICLDYFEPYTKSINLPDQLTSFLVPPQEECTNSGKITDKNSVATNIQTRLEKLKKYAENLKSLYPDISDKLEILTLASKQLIAEEHFPFSSKKRWENYADWEKVILERLFPVLKHELYASQILLPQNKSSLTNDTKYQNAIVAFAGLPKKISPTIFDMMLSSSRQQASSFFRWTVSTIFGKIQNPIDWAKAKGAESFLGPQGLEKLREVPEPKAADLLRTYINEVPLGDIQKTISSMNFSQAPGIANVEQQASGLISGVSQSVQNLSTQLTKPSSGIFRQLVVDKITSSLSDALALSQPALSAVNALLKITLTQTNEIYKSIGTTTKDSLSDMIEELTMPLLYTADEIHLLFYKMAKKNVEIRKSERESFTEGNKALTEKNKQLDNLDPKNISDYFKQLPKKLQDRAEAEGKKLATQAAFLSVPQDTIMKIQKAGALKKAGLDLEKEIFARSKYRDSLEEDLKAIKTDIYQNKLRIASIKEKISTIENMGWWKRWLYSSKLSKLEEELEAKRRQGIRIARELSTFKETIQKQNLEYIKLDKLQRRQKKLTKNPSSTKTKIKKLTKSQLEGAIKATQE